MQYLARYIAESQFLTVGKLSVNFGDWRLTESEGFCAFDYVFDPGAVVGVYCEWDAQYFLELGNCASMVNVAVGA